MAVRGDEDEGAIEFSRHDDPCLQLAHLTAELGTGEVVTLTTYQDMTCFGLLLQAGHEPPDRVTDGIFRWRQLPELPTGLVESALVRVEDQWESHPLPAATDVLAELALVVGGRELLLLAGEAYETREGSLRWCRFDESVLAFTAPANADAIRWAPPRTAGR